MPVSSSLPETLARLRKARDLSQDELAEAASVGVDTVGRIERGERQTVRPETLDKLAKALGVAPTTLVGGIILPRGVMVGDAAELRRAIMSTSEIPGLVAFAESYEVISIRELTRTVRRAWAG